MASGFTQFFGKTDPAAVLESLIQDLTARGAILPGAATLARPLVEQGQLPSTALIAVGVADDVVRRSLAGVMGFAEAPPPARWDRSARHHARDVSDAQWLALLAIPVGVVAGRPVVAFADVSQIASSAALALPAHEAVVALESEVRAALSVAAPKPAKAAVAFLAPPSALLQGLSTSSSSTSPVAAFGAGTAPALGATRAGAMPAMTPSPSPPSPVAAMPSPGPLPAIKTPTPSTSPFSTPAPAGAARAALPGTMVGGVPSTTSGQMVSPTAPTVPPVAATTTTTEARTIIGTAHVPTPPPPAPSSPSSSPSSSPAVSFEPPAGFDRTLLGPGALDTPSPAAHPPGSTPAPSAQAAPASTLQQAAAAASGVGIGSRCGRFTLERRLGEGGMATVFIGLGDDGVERVAVKVVHEHLLRSSMGEDLRRRFQREVSAMRQLQHPNIVSCIDAGSALDTEYLATEFVGGGSLSDLLGRTGKLPSPLAMACFGDLLEGLAHAHDKGIIHRDLKPDNLLLELDGTLKIADFGIARVTEGTALTATGTFVGTPAYMSPEQAMANPVDVRSDLYSAGVILYELLSGRNPFADAQVMTTLANVLQGNWRPLGEVEVSTPLLVDHVVARLLATRPDDRLPSAKAVLDALRPLIDEARAWRDLWREVVGKVDGAMGRALERAANDIVTAARREQAAGEARRLSAGFLAFRATSLSPDHKDARPMLRALGHGTTLRFGRSPNLYAMEAEAERAGDRRAAFREVARAYLDEQNPNFAAQWARRAVNGQGVDDVDVALLAATMPLDEVELLVGLPDRLGLAMPRSQQFTIASRGMNARAGDAPPRSSSAISLTAMGQAATGAPPPVMTVAGMPVPSGASPSAAASPTGGDGSRGPPRALIAAGAVIVVLVLVIVLLVMRGGS